MGWRTLRPVAGGTLVAAAALWLLAAPVAADGGPHVAGVNSGSTTLAADSCAGCHRAHTAPGENLIAASTEVGLCLTCHGPAAAGATTDVVDGVKAGTATGLRGGGFGNALMDTAWTGAAVSRPATSAHMTDGATNVTMWGNGAIGSGAGPTTTLTCADCHNPHGNATYRILRPIPTGSGATVDVVVPDQPIPVYTVASAQNRYFGEVYGNGNYNWQEMYALDEWCAACHTRYDAPESGQATTDSGDPTFRYRHVTRWPVGSIDCMVCHSGALGIVAPNPFGITYRTAHEPVCQNCHVAHGSAAQMGTFSGVVPWPDGATTPSGNARSSLLRLDNRGVCAGCHDPTN
jgi:predicted CXXCH cytochrome family protein